MEEEIWELRIDALDVAILDLLYHSKIKMTTTDIAKTLFYYENKYDLMRSDNFVRKRLKKLKKYGLVECIKENNKMYYTINHINIIFEEDGGVLFRVGEIVVKIWELETSRPRFSGNMQNIYMFEDNNEVNIEQ